MSIQYVNREGQVYYLHKGIGKTGKPMYFFSMRADGDLAGALPVGYEIYENHYAQVFCRRIPPRIVSPEELAIVRDAARRLAPHQPVFIDVKKNAIIVYEDDSSAQAVFRFTLADRERRLFSLERWCFLGSIDRWIYLDGIKSITFLAEEYLPHLGKESFFELHRGVW